MSAQSMFPGLTASRFTRQITRLNLISSGPGSVTVGQNVKNVELLFKRLNTDGHMGARKFWRENLPRVQFHNPALPIQVTRVEVANASEHAKVPAILKVTYADGKTAQVDVKNKHSSDILNDFINLTGAKPAKEVIIDRDPRGIQ
ncbi:hypothetical protein WICANDRAFT_107655 [Wickerhamomyces anomalus NRRL Y-366-8]|uniref:Ribosomal protein/NADH dehydrogenase domain-containing protein n=1 Tax=Wickerhamomyces anomalus (strain ATCC 58044 / CBS 1984 / NCYC 433 / NRRL Y-366-8) TaxID=683960 RepID=A0A1E3NUG4_WICAA|nr:uncharacterized protein WICANDRAFT_107655 [Wickerhamomyces anomalus NRRL Y-366-8]ODQ56723.1 hypothetical protein WICANDRAFT_107655 [Wickerhamomyces anomalus NRRL Y-366-8]